MTQMNIAMKKHTKRLLATILAVALILVSIGDISVIKVKASTVELPSGYTNDDVEGAKMCYSLFNSGNIDIKGIFNNNWLQATYGNSGFFTALKVGDTTYQAKEIDENNIVTKYDKYENGENCNNDIDYLQLSINPQVSADGLFVEFHYSVQNASGSAITYSLASATDVQIGNDDNAPISLVKNKNNTKDIGFCMTSSSDGDEGNRPSLMLFAGEVAGVTDVDKFWFGHYYSIYPDNAGAPFCLEQTTDNLTGTDSGCSFEWTDRTINPGETNEYCVKIGIGNADELLKAANAEADATSTQITVNDVKEDTLYSLWTITGEGETVTYEKVRDWVGSEVAVDGKIVFTDLTPDTKYIVKTVLKDNKPEGEEPDSAAIEETEVTTNIDPFKPTEEGGPKPTYEAVKDTIVITNPNTNYTYSLVDAKGNIAKDADGNEITPIAGSDATDGKITFKGLASNTTYYISVKSDTNPNSDPLNTLTELQIGGGITENNTGNTLDKLDNVPDGIDGANLDTWSISDNAISEEDKGKIEKVTSSNKVSAVDFVELDLQLTAAGVVEGHANTSNTPIEIELIVPNPIEGRSYKVVQMNSDGSVGDPVGEYDEETKKITFSTQTFGKAAIVVDANAFVDNTISGGTGSIRGEVYSDKDLPAVRVADMSSQALLETGKTEAAELDANYRVYLDITSNTTITDDDKEKIVTVFPEKVKDDKVKYLDINLHLLINNTVDSLITEAQSEYEITMGIPADIKNTSSRIKRDYYVVRLHNGIAEDLNATNNGDGTITFKSSKFSEYAIGYVDTIVAGDIVDVTGITSQTDKITLTKVGDTVSIAVTITPANATNKNLIYKSSDEKVATVDATGKVTAVGDGKATIIVTTVDGNKVVTIDVIVDTSAETAKIVAENFKKQYKAILQKNRKDITKADLATIEKALADYDQLSESAKALLQAEKADLDAKKKAAEQTDSKNNVKDQSKLTGNEIAQLKLPVFIATGKAKNKTDIVITWSKQAKATGYDIYWSYCDGKKNFKKLATVKAGKSLSYTVKNLKSSTGTKYFVVAYKMVDGKKIYISKTPQIHVATKGNKYTNAKSIKVNNSSVVLKVKKTFTIKASIVKEDAKKKLLTHASNLRFYTSNKKVATVDKNGTIKAVAKGTCTIYVIANNGVSKKITVTVK
ncbi:Ig-like domain-containing protein [Anaerosporobacter faecicola]|uniref:Ig-like domain-containing protein n=1 Tax=Anaerosporobacter faecicola TaxID=2718714 RepID=UPI00143B5590|nr:Ig-like domain-containing protein [Anaerosporobacter faecicola]